MANSYQSIKTCEALSRVGCLVTLFYSVRRDALAKRVRNLRSYYGVGTMPALRYLPLINIPEKFHSRSYYIAFVHFLRFLTFILPFLFWAAFKTRASDAVLFTREISVLPIMRIFTRIPMIFEMHESSFSGRGRFIEKFGVQALMYCAAIVTLSDLQKKYLIGLGIRADKIYRVQHGCDIELFGNARAVNLRQLQPGCQKVVLYAGSLYERKNPEFMVKAAQALSEKFGQNVALCILGGKDADIARTRKIAHTLGVHNVFFGGHVSPSSVPAYLSGAAVLIHYSQPNSLSASPLKIFEYMAVGKPIVAPDEPVIREVVEDKVNGLLFDPDKPSDLADKVAYLINNEGYANEMGKVNRQLAINKYSYDLRGQRLKSIAEKCLASRSV